MKAKKHLTACGIRQSNKPEKDPLDFEANDFQNDFILNKNLDMEIDFLKNDNEYRTLDHDFKNLKNLEVSENNEKSLNLGSEYSQNEYQFDDKVSSVQRDLSLENWTDEYNSILNSSDVSNSENNNSLKKKNNKIGGLSKNKSKAQLGGLQGMARIKSSVKLFTVDDNEEPDNEEEKILGGKLIHKKKKKNPNDSVSISDLSTGDSAYPVLAFKSRIIKEFEPKVSIFSINMKQLEIQSNFSKVPRHTKLRYEEPIHWKEVNSPPIEWSFDK